MDKAELVQIACAMCSTTDVAHDFFHALRVLGNAEAIQAEEGGDIDVLTPAALFHDVVIYPKNHPDSPRAPQESANRVWVILEEAGYPAEKTEMVRSAIVQCSWGKAPPDFLEGRILQDADRLEATGGHAVMRTFASAGQMGMTFYHPSDPFCGKRAPDSMEGALDLFFTRLLKVKERVHTFTARRMAEEREAFLYIFLAELKRDLGI